MDFNRVAISLVAAVVWTWACEGPPKPSSGDDGTEPRLVVSPDTLDFGETDTTLSFSVENAGGGVLYWLLQLPSGGWIAASPDCGSVVDTPATVSVQIDRREASVGSLQATLTVFAGGEEKELVLTGFISQADRLRISPVSLDFGSLSTELSVQLMNTGSGNLGWRLASAQQWIAVTPDTAVVGGHSSDRIRVEVDRSQLAPGEHVGSVEVVSSCVCLSIPVAVFVPLPEISLSVRFVDFRADREEMTVEIANTGTGELSWEFQSDLPWLTVEPSAGIAGGSSSFVTLSVGRQNLDSGIHEGLISISSNAIAEPVVQLRVKMQVLEQPALRVTPEVLNFGDTTDWLDLFIANANNGTLSWEAQAGEPWLTLGALRGDVFFAEQAPIRIDVSREGLAAGIYRTQVAINSNGGSTTIAVEMEVAQQPLLVLESGDLDFGAAFAERILDLGNAGTGQLSWEIQEEIGWLEVEPDGGVALGEASQVRFTVNREGLDPGNYIGEVRISSNGGDQSVSVSMAVSAEVVLTATVDRIDFGEEEETQVLAISNRGNTSCSWTLPASESWIQVAPADGTLGPGQSQDIEIRAVRSEMSAGEYEAVLALEKDGSGDPILISVAMTVPNNPPIADAGGDRVVFLDEEAQLDGSGSRDVDMDDLIYAWQQVGGPVVVLGDAASAVLDWTPIEVGVYRFSLVVNDGTADSAADEVEVIVEIKRQAGEQQTAELPGGVTIEFVWIEPGTFIMGMTAEQEVLLREKGEWFEWFENEFPAHEVTISKGFFLGKFEITQEQWESVLDSRPWEGQENVREGPNFPAGNISWSDAQDFVRELNGIEGRDIYRLPTEAEWEYAARAGTETLWFFGDESRYLEEYAWYRMNAWEKEERYGHEVGRKKANPWGLHDIYGNVWELCQDEGIREYTVDVQVDPMGAGSSAERVLRGGSFLFHDIVERSAYRIVDTPGRREADYGLRLLRIK